MEHIGQKTKEMPVKADLTQDRAEHEKVKKAASAADSPFLLSGQGQRRGKRGSGFDPASFFHPADSSAEKRFPPI